MMTYIRLRREIHKSKRNKKKLKKLKFFFDNNINFYTSCIRKNVFVDKKLLDNGDAGLLLDTYYFQFDQFFPSVQSYKAAKIMTYVYVQAPSYNRRKKHKSKKQKKLKWSGSKVALIELIYALHYQGVFDNGNNDIREVAQYFESAFGVDLGNFYQTYLELRNRKMNRTKFLDALREELIRRMDEQDEK